MLAAAKAVILSATERGGISRAIDDFEEAVPRFGIVDRRATRLTCCDEGDPVSTGRWLERWHATRSAARLTASAPSAR